MRKVSVALQAVCQGSQIGFSLHAASGEAHSHRRELLLLTTSAAHVAVRDTAVRGHCLCCFSSKSFAHREVLLATSGFETCCR